MRNRIIYISLLSKRKTEVLFDLCGLWTDSNRPRQMLDCLVESVFSSSA